MNYLLLSDTYKYLLRAAALLTWVLCLPSQVTADQLTIGILSYDLPGASAQFTVTNETGANSLSPDFPVVDPLTFTSLSIQYFLKSGASSVITSSDIAPNSSNGPFGDLKFDPAAGIIEAVITGKINKSTFQVDLGSGAVTYVAAPSTFTATLLPSVGSTLQAGLDLTVITISASQQGISTPEPSPVSLMSLCALCLWMLGLLNRRHSLRR